MHHALADYAVHPRAHRYVWSSIEPSLKEAAQA
jgi:hypothetical protein